MPTEPYACRQIARAGLSERPGFLFLVFFSKSKGERKTILERFHVPPAGSIAGGLGFGTSQVILP